MLFKQHLTTRVHLHAGDATEVTRVDYKITSPNTRHFISKPLAKRLCLSGLRSRSWSACDSSPQWQQMLAMLLLLWIDCAAVTTHKEAYTQAVHASWTRRWTGNIYSKWLLSLHRRLLSPPSGSVSTTNAYRSLRATAKVRAFSKPPDISAAVGWPNSLEFGVVVV